MTKRELDEDDLDQLAELCLAAYGFPSDLEVEPLSHEHAPQVAASSQHVLVEFVSEVEDVDDLAPGSGVSFGESGLTLVFGRNRSGKSGYVRILKQACEARSVMPLRGDVFSDATPSPSALIHYTVDGDAQKHRVDGSEATPSELRSAVRVYDDECGAVLRGSANEVLYRPFELDLLESLAEAADRVRSVIASRVDDLGPSRLALDGVAEGTGARAFVDGLAPKTTDEEIRAACEFGDEAAGRLEELIALLSGDRSREALRQEEVRIQRFENLRDRLSAIDDGLGEEATDRVRALHDTATSAREASRLASEQAFRDEALAGVGGDVWRQLWEAARRYSNEVAYPEEDFPVSGDDAVCVLCEQPLSDDASARLHRLEEFVQQDVQERAERSEADLEEALEHVRAIRIEDPDDDARWEELSSHDEELSTRCREYVAAQTTRRQQIERACSGGDWAAVDAAPAAVHDEFEAVLARVRERLDTLRGAVDGEEREKFVVERAELEARQALAARVDDLTRERDRLRERAVLQKALSDTSTQAISHKSRALADRYLTDALVEAFEDEVDRLGLERVALVSAGGKKGVVRHQVQLDGAQAGTAVDDVFSEGERSALGLAGFLAELDPSVSSIVLDDPVTSLDHDNRLAIARRLVQLARDRQVIVFTHDAVFALWLCTAAEDLEVDVTGRELVRAPLPGVCRDALPWTAQSVKQRLGELQEVIARARRLIDDGAPEASGVVTEFYKRLRTLWERALEESLLGPMLTRYSTEVHTKPILRLPQFSQDDARQFEEGYSKACTHGEVHDENPAVNLELPTADDMTADVEMLRDWNDRMRKMMSPRGGSK